MEPEMTSSSFFKSARAARGNPQFATFQIPQWSATRSNLAGSGCGTYWTPKMSAWAHEKGVPGEHKRRQSTGKKKVSQLKKYSLAAGERSQAVKVEAILFGIG